MKKQHPENFMKHLRTIATFSFTALFTLITLTTPLLAAVPNPYSHFENKDQEAIRWDTTWYDSDYDPQAAQVCMPGASNIPDVGLTASAEERAAAIWDYFIDPAKGLTPAQVAGIMGNIHLESGGTFDPRIQYGGKTTDSPNPGIAWGIVQWLGSRQTELVKRHGTAANTLAAQVEFIWYELNGTESRALAALKKETDAGKAAIAFENTYERSGHTASFPLRIQYAQAALAKYGSQTGRGNTVPMISTNNCTPTGSGGSAFVTGNYAWPVALGASEVSAGWPLPCSGASCHHDVTPAFDLAHKQTVSGNKFGEYDSKSVGVAVYAITSGTYAYDPKVYLGITGCYSIQFKGDDGYNYWYGHIRNPVKFDADGKFAAGEKIAEIGERKCTGNSSYPHLHIDRGSPKGKNGGSACCRDPGMVPLINDLYEKLKKSEGAA